MRKTRDELCDELCEFCRECIKESLIPVEYTGQPGCDTAIYFDISTDEMWCGDQDGSVPCVPDDDVYCIMVLNTSSSDWTLSLVEVIELLVHDNNLDVDLDELYEEYEVYEVAKMLEKKYPKEWEETLDSCLECAADDRFDCCCDNIDEALDQRDEYLEDEEDED